MVLTSITHAASNAHKKLDDKLLSKMATWLASEDVRSVVHATTQRQLVLVVANLVDLAGESCQAVAEPLFHVLLHLQGNKELDSYTQQQVQEVSHLLSECRSVLLYPILWLYLRVQQSTTLKHGILCTMLLLSTNYHKPCPSSEPQCRHNKSWHERAV